MLICPACSEFGDGLCARCAASLSPAPVRLVAALPVYAGWRHQGAARRLVHRLKYRSWHPAAAVLADRMAAVLPAGAGVLVPVPRARGRVHRYGLDPALLLAREVAVRTGLAVVPALRAGWWWPRHAGAGRLRTGPRFSVRRPVPAGALLVDDVVTTGSTLRAAVQAIGHVPMGGLAATSAGTMTGRIRV